MNGGYILVDAKGLSDVNLPGTVPGFYSHISRALSSGKECVLCNVKLGGIQYSPSSVVLYPHGEEGAIRISFRSATITVDPDDYVSVGA